MTNSELLVETQKLFTDIVRALDANVPDELIAELVRAHELNWEIIPELEGVGLLALRSWLERRPTSDVAREHLQDLLVGLGRTQELGRIASGAPVEVIDPLSKTNVERHKQLVQATVDARRPTVDTPIITGTEPPK